MCVYWKPASMLTTLVLYGCVVLCCVVLCHVGVRGVIKLKTSINLVALVALDRAAKKT